MSIQVQTHACFLLFLTAFLSSPFASSVLVPSSPPRLHYHRGPLLAGHGPLKLYLTFYGDFAYVDKHTIKSFLHSLRDPAPAGSHIAQVSSSKEGAPRLRHTARRLSQLTSAVSSSYSLITSAAPAASSASELKPLLIQNSSSSAPPAASELKPLLTQNSSTAEGHPNPLRGSGSASSYNSADRQQISATSDPTVAKWWSLTRAYTDSYGNGVSQTLLIQHEASDDYSHGKLLSRSALASLATISAQRARAAGGISHTDVAEVEDHVSLHLIFTAQDVGVEGFCMHSCGYHAHTESENGVGKVVYAWVGNAREQCPGYCAWPFVRAEYGPDTEPLKAPNDASADGMVINLAKVLVEAATNPFGNGYSLGGESHGVGVSSACTGMYGDGAFPGYPGRTLEDAVTGASFNIRGLKQAQFLLPYIWNPLTLSCAVQPPQ